MAAMRVTGSLESSPPAREATRGPSGFRFFVGDLPRASMLVGARRRPTGMRNEKKQGPALTPRLGVGSNVAVLLAVRSCLGSVILCLFLILK